MSNEIYANGNSVSCKAGDGKVIAAMPDVCLSPPSPPAGPIPIPYPATSFSKDMQNGSKTVQIGGQEVMLKDQSFFQTSPLGDEAATKGLGAGVVTHVITGKTYFAAWSMDVQFEGANVDRNLDLTTSNHASPPPNTPPMPEAELVAVGAVAAVAATETCPCCKGPKHANQKGPGVKQVSEAEWYGPDGHKKVLEARAKGCKCVPAEADKDCGTYYKQPNKEQRKKARKKWESKYKKEFVARYNAENPFMVPIVIESDPKKEGEPICHKVPIAAGGCTKNDDNLQRKSDMSHDCQKLDDDLTNFHTSQTIVHDTP